jgi:hypothetical protein
VKLAVLRALKNRVREVELEITAEFLSSMDVGDAKSAILADGTMLGKATKIRGRETPHVVDESAFLAWVQNRHPSEIVTAVRPAYRAKLLLSAKVNGMAVDGSTGEVVPGITVDTADPYISFRSEKGGSEVIAARWYDLVGPAFLTAGEP